MDHARLIYIPIQYNSNKRYVIKSRDIQYVMKHMNSANRNLEM